MTTVPTQIPLLDGTPSLVGYGDGVVLLMRTDGKPGFVYRTDDVTLLIDKLQIAQDASRGGAAGSPSRAEPPAAAEDVPGNPDGDAP
ncbi:MAG: hypothetical protein ACRDQD_01145 [Nocardioidaceae bacterium]